MIWGRVRAQPCSNRLPLCAQGRAIVTTRNGITASYLDSESASVPPVDNVLRGWARPAGIKVGP